MKLDIRECLELRAAASIDTRNDELLAYCLEELAPETAIVVPQSFLRRTHAIKKSRLLDEYDIASICDLGAPYPNTNMPMALLALVRKDGHTRRTVRVANWHGDEYNRFEEEPAYRNRDNMTLPSRFTEEYETYLSALEAWHDAGKLPADRGSCEFVELARTTVDMGHLTPKYYCNRARSLRKSLAKTTVGKLSDVADVLIPKPMDSAKGVASVLDMGSAGYPLDASGVRRRLRTTIVLSKGDLVYSLMRDRDPYLFREELDEDVYAPPFTAVIRCAEIAPEYLHLYLTSETGALLREMLCSEGPLERMSVTDLKDLPVVYPDKPAEHYIQLFESTHYLVADFSKCYSLQAAMDSIVADEASSAEDILDAELIETMAVFQGGIRRDILASDLQELNTCYAHGAYKATLIMAGSILEAIMIDWLSEMRGRNYFDENEKYVDGRGRVVDNLAGYISEIRFLKRPEWIESEKAFEIKDKRNLVHAKLCMKEDVKIDAMTCEMVISYLKDVIASRNRFANR